MKYLKLEDMQLHKLSDQEMIQLNGGCDWICLGRIVEFFSNLWGGFVQGFNEGLHDGIESN